MKADLIDNLINNLLIKHSIVKTVFNNAFKIDQNNRAMQVMINIQTNRSEGDIFILSVDKV